MLPDRYPLGLDVERYVADEQHLGRLLDYAVIVPRLQRLYEWSSVELGEPRVLELVRDGSPIYAWPVEERHVWRSADRPLVGRALGRDQGALTRVPNAPGSSCCRVSRPASERRRSQACGDDAARLSTWS